MLDENGKPMIPISAAEFAREVGLTRCQVNHWVTRGYLNDDGERIHVKPFGHRKVGGRKFPVYLRSDLSAAEKATRDRAPTLRREPTIAAHQLMKRPHLASQLRREAAA